tara:strand:- start:77894 stop:78505 length:612 start_codon:yes stop_codon:yes gene_type:complete
MFTASFGQGEVDVQTTPELDSISTVEQTIVYYAKDFIEGTKYVGGEAIDLIGQGVDVIITEGTIVVKQYLIYTSIKHGIPVFIGFWLLLFLSRRLHKKFSIKKENAIFENQNTDDAQNALDDAKDDDTPSWQVDDITLKKNIKFLGTYYKNIMNIILAWAGSIIPIIVGISLLVSHLMIFIKVTFLPKLYLAELILKYLEITI